MKSLKSNREEAVRAKELAEKKMNSKDYVGAQTMISKAQKLYPSMENVSKMLFVCQVHCSSERKVHGSEPDWYDILQVEQTADEGCIRKQFKKLAVQLHPDKNKFPGAEAAFKLIGQAQRFLCDPLKRSQFDITLKIMRPGQQRKPQNQPGRNDYPSKQPEMHSNPASAGTEAPFTSMNRHQQKQQQTQSLFWTECPFCGVRYQYYIHIMHKTIRCQECMKPFIAFHQDGQKMASVSQPPAMSGRDFLVGRAPKPNAKEDVNVRVEAGMKEKSIPDEPKPPGAKNRKRERNYDSKEETGSSCNMEEYGDHEAGQNPGCNTGRSSRRKHDVSYKEKLSDDGDIASGSRRETTRINEPVDKLKLPILDFYDFDKDKREECFAFDQIWALFDDLDGMPRYYARINKVYSPFKVDLTWLEFVPGDLDETAWKRSGLPVACGKFKHEKTDTIEDKDTFSHKIVCEKAGGNTFKIYPQKGETWALYKNWNIKWSSEPNNHREYEYKFVVVLSDYTSESGILVAQLVKLKGFACLFKPAETNGMSSLQIPSHEMLIFSNRVPSFKTTGGERKDVPEGYFELDPASLPSNLEEVSDFIDVKAATVDGNSTRISNEFCKNLNEENVEESKISSTSDGVTAKAERVSEQIPPSPSSFTDTCELPESIFYTFEDDKTEDNFQVDQVWALYCGLDGLPKYYGLIKKVELIPEFKANIQWLEACTPPKGILHFLDNEMPIGCGVFSRGEET
ncbi:hypothetical protein MKX03_013994 [Papaver bracteatum]|nr:hypothetical protein MKX03_013994 [Papaver bracteatum]